MISLPSEYLASTGRVAEGLLHLRVVMVNVYAVSNPDASWVLVDAGLPFSAGKILAWVEHHFGRDSRPECIILTHGHFDHVGAVKELSELWDVPVYAHPLEMPYLTGASCYPPPDPTVGGGALSLLSFIYPKSAIRINDRVRPLPQDGRVPGLPDWRWIHTPGHTAGHISLFRDADRVLIAGDAITTTKQESLTSVVAQRPEMHGPPAYFTTDWEAAELSVRRLAALIPDVIATGHGKPISGPKVADRLDELAENFVDWARPAHGRYVREPAVTDERGIVRLPPPPIASQATILTVLATVGVAAALWYAFGKTDTDATQ
jgi:glyoxylase-like metal-dependent hydrolase (beta-lactamase superfamily II)